MTQTPYHPPIKRSITLSGHATSISLEPMFWDKLKAAAAARKVPVAALVGEIDLERMQAETPPGLASAIRIWLMAQGDTAMSGSAIQFRIAGPKDYAALGQLVYDAVHAEPSPYSPAQRFAWMPEPRKGSDWDARLAKQHIVTAEDETGTIIGFVSLEPQDDPRHGYIDFAYIRGEARGMGLFRRLYDRIAAYALGAGQTRLTVHASLAAQPAFAAMGFTVTAEEEVAIGSEALRRFAMEMELA
ncbi:GNAT family N-acetyltransferase [Alterisphingorhabdus coralli]|uniref:GNAT family N-acetyltransferase n=1 Tax=Alterisphingorhabdus coralli TaxID=3071408 RepID=A0AA97F8D2_9SPHN|nr:GNAT family N-acetyltransferase [Parasphingorhabdus sp. SCSIO 66989]WOE75811.1 GNAT family N-acetyltransferase [Parasphingorhabdus sp. SCSIO 66989]